MLLKKEPRPGSRPRSSNAAAGWRCCADTAGGGRGRLLVSHGAQLLASGCLSHAYATELQAIAKGWRDAKCRCCRCCRCCQRRRCWSTAWSGRPRRRQSRVSVIVVVVGCEPVGTGGEIPMLVADVVKATVAVKDAACRVPVAAACACRAAVGRCNDSAAWWPMETDGLVCGFC